MRNRWRPRADPHDALEPGCDNFISVSGECAPRPVSPRQTKKKVSWIEGSALLSLSLSLSLSLNEVVAKHKHKARATPDSLGYTLNRCLHLPL